MVLPRLGAACVQDHNRVVILGGVGCSGVVSQEDEILVCTLEDAKLQVTGRITIPTTGDNTNIPRPLIVGSSVANLQNGQVIILGGGATCFSMGTFCMWLFLTSSNNVATSHGRNDSLAYGDIQGKSVSRE